MKDCLLLNHAKWLIVLFVFFSLSPIYLYFADDSELDAQISATFPFGASQRYIEAAVFNVPHICVQGNRIYRRNRISKWKGKLIRIVATPHTHFGCWSINHIRYVIVRCDDVMCAWHTVIEADVVGCYSASDALSLLWCTRWIILKTIKYAQRTFAQSYIKSTFIINIFFSFRFYRSHNWKSTTIHSQKVSETLVLAKGRKSKCASLI